MKQHKIQYDAVCKNLLAHRDILAYILKYCIEEYKNIDIHTIKDLIFDIQIGKEKVHRNHSLITPLQNEDKTIDEGSVTFDIYFAARLPESNDVFDLFVNIEAQKSIREKYPISARGVYYGSRMVSKQHGVTFNHSDYGNLKKVYSIWICLYVPKEEQNSIAVIQLEKNVLLGVNKIPRKDYDKMCIVMVYLGKESTHECIRLLEVLLDSQMKSKEKINILENEYEIEVDDIMEKEVSNMCNLSDYVEEKGIKKDLNLELNKGFNKVEKQFF